MTQGKQQNTTPHPPRVAPGHPRSSPPTPIPRIPSICTHSLAKALVKVFRGSLIATALLALAQQVVLLGVPLIVQQLLKWLIDVDNEETYIGVIWAVAL